MTLKHVGGGRWVDFGKDRTPRRYAKDPQLDQKLRERESWRIRQAAFRAARAAVLASHRAQPAPRY